MALAGAQVIVGAGISLAPNPEGWFGGILYVALYAVPLVVLGLMLRSSRRLWRSVAGWLALFLGVCYSIVVIGNWSGYTAQQAIFATAISVPTVAVDLAIFWVALLIRPRRSAPFGPAAQ